MIMIDHDNGYLNESFFDFVTLNGWLLPYGIPRVGFSRLILSMLCRQIFGLGSEETRRCKINLKDEHGEI
jgi:hypothetical protein